MSQRSVFARQMMLASACLGTSLMAVSTVYAQSPATTDASAAADIETSMYTFAGEVNADGMLVRSGPSENDYPVLKLPKGSKLTVVGLRHDWLKIEPPAGAFCLVPQAFVDKRGDGTQGRIVNNRATVRIGSALTPSKHKVPTQLDPGQDVTILGESEEYYKIAPPKGVYLYVDKRFVNPIRRLDADNTNTTANNLPETAKQPPTTPAPTATPTPPVADNTAPTSPTGDQTASNTGGATPTITEQPTPVAGRLPGDRFNVRSADGTAAPEGGATTQPSVDAEAIRGLQERLSKLEDRYAAAGQQDLTEQPIDALLNDYNALIADAKLPPNARKVTEFRAQALKLRKETLEQYLAAKKMQAEIAAKQDELKAEQEELKARVAEAAVKRYAAVGRLVTSSLQAGNQTLFRLVDPANNRTIIYVRGGAAPIATGLNQFIAINGQVTKDDAMKLTYITPENFEVVDPKKVNTKVFADFTPPSLMTTNAIADSVSAR